MKNDLFTYLNEMFPNPKCELNYQKDYELLMATVLSAQSTDKRVNEVTRILFQYYDLSKLSEANISEIEDVIKPVGTYKRKAIYLKEIAKHLVNDYKGMVPNNREYLESLPGVGRKTCNVVLSNLYNLPAIAVDTHVERCSKRLGIAEISDDVIQIEKKLNKLIPRNKWNIVGNQILLFGRYICKSQKPLCENCKLKKYCKKKDL